MNKIIITKIEIPEGVADEQEGFFVPLKEPAIPSVITTIPPISCYGLTSEGERCKANQFSPKLMIGNFMHLDLDGVLSIPSSKYPYVLGFNEEFDDGTEITIQDSLVRITSLWNWGIRLRKEQDQLLTEITEMLPGWRIRLSEVDRSTFVRYNVSIAQEIIRKLHNEIGSPPSKEQSLASTLSELRKRLDKTIIRRNVESIEAQRSEKDRRDIQEREEKDKARLESIIRQTFPLPTTD